MVDKDTESNVEYGLWRQSILYRLTFLPWGPQFPHFYGINFLFIQGLIKCKFFLKNYEIKGCIRNRCVFLSTHNTITSIQFILNVDKISHFD